MGLDFSHCEARWGYSGFNRFREKLAAEAGIALSCMESFAWDFKNNMSYKNVKVIGYGEFSEIISSFQPVIKWSTITDDIKPLLNHSDCDGELTPNECRKVAPRLRELIKSWPDDDRDKINALLLADGMDLARSKRQKLKFT